MRLNGSVVSEKYATFESSIKLLSVQTILVDGSERILYDGNVCLYHILSGCKIHVPRRYKLKTASIKHHCCFRFCVNFL